LAMSKPILTAASMTFLRSLSAHPSWTFVGEPSTASEAGIRHWKRWWYVSSRSSQEVFSREGPLHRDLAERIQHIATPKEIGKQHIQTEIYLSYKLI